MAIEVWRSWRARNRPDAGLPDDLVRARRQITKREIRAVTLSALAPRRGERLWDIGAGQVGRDRMDVGRSRDAGHRHRMRSDAPPARAQCRGVPACLGSKSSRATPRGARRSRRPDAMFIGGAPARRMLDRATAALRSGGRLVVNGVTLETEAA